MNSSAVWCVCLCVCSEDRRTASVIALPPGVECLTVDRECVSSSPSFLVLVLVSGWLGSRVVSVLDSGAEGPGFKSQSRRCWVTVLGKLFTLTVPLFTKQQNW